MTQARIAAELTNDAVVYSLAASLAFLVFVLVLDPRLWRTPIGRSLILLDIGLLALYVPSVLHRFFGLQVTNVAFAWYYLATVLAVGSAVWWRTVIMIRAQLRGRRNGRGRTGRGSALEPKAGGVGDQYGCLGRGCRMLPRSISSRSA